MRRAGSTTRHRADEFVTRLTEDTNAEVIYRDLATDPLPAIDETWVGATFTPVDQRTPEQHAALSLSDDLVAELQGADTIVLAVPMYNFTVPAAVKAWLDLVARAGVTFRYTDQGPVGLLSDKKVYLILASGGTPIGSSADYLSGYLMHMLAFLGLSDVTIVKEG